MAILNAREASVAQREARVARMDAQQRQQRARLEYGDPALDDLTKADWSAETYDPSRSQSVDGGPTPFAQAVTWLGAIQTYEHAGWDPYTAPGAYGNYQDPACPAVALMFVGKPGRGKTHLAGAIAQMALNNGRSVRRINEAAYLAAYWADLSNQSAMITKLAVQPWLLIIDDVGQRANGGPGVNDAYYALINKRYERAGWTIITSNYSLDDLQDRRILTSVSVSRLTQMTRKHEILCGGPDLRAVAPKERAA